MQQIVIKNHTYAVIDMKDTYPFAAVQSATEQVVLVRKNLVYHNPQQLQIIEKMSDILYSLDHQHLIAFVHAEESIPNSCSFFYEYVPLTIDKWLLEIGEELVDQLEFQLTSLAGYLTGNGVKFAFDPTCVGLSKEIKIKYFLKEFTVDNENKLLNYKDNQNKIASFFAQLRATQQQSLSENSANKLDRGSFESTRKVDSFGTCESWGIKSFHSDGSSHAKQQPKPTLTGRVEDAKKRSLELLARMKGLKGKPV